MVVKWLPCLTDYLWEPCVAPWAAVCLLPATLWLSPNDRSLSRKLRTLSMSWRTWASLLYCHLLAINISSLLEAPGEGGLSLVILVETAERKRWSDRFYSAQNLSTKINPQSEEFLYGEWVRERWESVKTGQQNTELLICSMRLIWLNRSCIMVRLLRMHWWERDVICFGIEGFHYLKIVNWVGIPMSWEQSANEEEGNVLF
jgi:hypothetical protein